MGEKEKQEKIEQLWQRLFDLQKEACKHKLCLLDKFTFNDTVLQLKELGALKNDN